MMAANGDEGKRPNGYVFLVGHGLLVLGYIFFTVGFATDHWMTKGSARYGLWEVCVGQLCQTAHPGDLSAWMEATRAMQTLALLCYMGGVLVALFVHCVTYTFPQPSCCKPLLGKTRVLEIFTAVGCVFCLIGVSVYGAKGIKYGTLKYSYALTVFSLFLTTIGLIMVAITRKAVHSLTAHNRVTPEQQPGGPYPQSSNGMSYPYGQGQNHRPQHPANGNSHQNDAPAYPYGQGSGSPFPTNPTQGPLPYSMYPDESGNFGSMGMPEPGGEGGGGAGLGVGSQSRGAHPGPGRLPPISEVSPTAPPSDSAYQGEQPPSYLEAIGQTPQHP